MYLMEISNLTVTFGGLKAINNLSLNVSEGEIRSLIGPNGAGKTTVLNVISGVYQADKGSSIEFKENQLLGKRADEIARLGISRTFQNLEVFSSLTTLENVLIGYHLNLNTNLFNEGFRTKGMKLSEKMAQSECMKIIEFVGLKGLEHEKACNLAFGQQRLLEIARALAVKPKLLLLDEPAAGMNPEEVRELNESLRTLRNKFGITIFLIEHVMALVMEVSDIISVIAFGEKIAEGKPLDVKNDQKVIEAYLGVDEEPES